MDSIDREYWNRQDDRKVKQMQSVKRELKSAGRDALGMIGHFKNKVKSKINNSAMAFGRKLGSYTIKAK